MEDLVSGTPGADVCSVCRTQGQITPATTWCSICNDVFCDGCLKLHNMMPMSRDHEVVAFSEPTKMNAKRPFMCKIHKNKQIELFCKDCKMAICHTCCSIKHRKCDDVDTLDSMTPIVKDILSQHSQELQINMTTSEKTIISGKSEIKEINANVQNVKDQIRKLRETVVEFISRKEKQLLDEVDRAHEELLRELQADIGSQEIRLHMYQQQHEFTTNAVTSNCEMDMYAIYGSLNEAATANKRKTDNRPARGRIAFTHDMDKLRKAVDQLHFGDVIILHGVSDWCLSPLLQNTIDCTTYDDKCIPLLHDVMVLNVDGVSVTVVPDYSNTRLKTYYTSKSKSSHGYLLLSNGPWQLAKLGECQIAVSVPDSSEIVSVKVTPDPVVLSTITTRKKYYALAYLSPSQLVAGTYGEPQSVDILDMTGKILKSFMTGVVGNPDYIHVTSNKNLIVSEGQVHSLVSVTSEGKAVFTYTPSGDRALSAPRGITTTSTGDILFVDSDSHKVIQLTESGQFVRDVLTKQDGLNCPRGTCLDGDSLLYVVCDRYVKVFKFC